ncbi:hypothetical protein NLI96_g3368 [Meripilus lineatus]|uniref:3-dehydrosphinganine reductase n=1 Tax=Meripilus lineatus TaxID=2056292 RepID=A0AAD5VBP7_9APHY|nr:hypothetical protein NLI96_g3368 [Physisporinus lineatus]
MLAEVCIFAFSWVVVYTLSSMIFRPNWNPRGRHCVVTGGSTGLGLSLAVLLTKKGADVSIIARNQERLDIALRELEAARQSPQQTLRAYSFNVDTAAGATTSLEAACSAHNGRAPDAVFLVAGGARPGFFVEQTEEMLKQQFDQNYWAQAWSAWAAAKKMAREKVRGKIVFVSSFLGYMSMVGYSPYAPGKFALRGLAETLQSELAMYGIDVHICFPGTIHSPGYEEENKVKPKVTLKIEETDGGAQPDDAAKGLLKGVEKGHFHITYDFLGDVFRASSRGSSPGNNFFLDAVYCLIGYVALPIWRNSVDRTVRAHAKEHREYLKQKGFFKSNTASSSS